MSEVAVIDAGGANFGSVCFALERLGAHPRLVRDADGLRGLPRVVVPGVGAAAAAVGAAATGVELVTPGLPVGPRCAGCCGRAYSPLPPNAVQAWGSVLGCGGTCATCQWRSV